MTLSRAKLYVALLAAVVGFALLPAATASATVATSSICKSYESEVTKQSKASTVLEREIQSDKSDKWPSIKKVLLATFKGESSAEKEFNLYLGAASAKVKSAAAVVLKLDGSFKTIIENSTSLTQYETGITKAESTPKVSAALDVLSAYTTKLCGSITPTTPTT